MAATDWVVLPSIWWENSPVVIQEAFQHGRPVICSALGGLKEKVVDGRDGMHFRRGDANDLARVLEAAVTTDLWETLVAGIETPFSASACARRHRELYFATPASAT